jgi:hydroxymethylpyrimidine/phosphomethylpyrimidine kinase
VSCVLVIAGCDSSGGAGLVRDVRTLTQLGVTVVCALSAVTAQTDQAVAAVQPLPAALLRAQLTAAFGSGRVTAVKIGMLASAENVAVVAEALDRAAGPATVLDPVLAASSGGALLEGAGFELLRSLLLPRVSLLTPNMPEAAALLGEPVARSEAQLLAQGAALLALGARAVLLKGGHASGADSTDLLFSAHGVRRFSAPRVGTQRRGSGCALSSAIAAGLAGGLDLTTACAHAKNYMREFFQHGK